MWASVAFTIYWLDYFRGPAKLPALDFKPLNCEACLPVWMFAAFATVDVLLPGIIGYLAAGLTCGIITPIILKWISK